MALAMPPPAANAAAPATAPVATLPMPFMTFLPAMSAPNAPQDIGSPIFHTLMQNH